MRPLKNKILILAALLSVSCGGPKIIPDKELARIFHDIYLTNAYINQYNIRLDSINVYEPVFAARGYTSEDIQYTIGNFAKRKSARLSDDVVEVARQMLLAEARVYSGRIRLRDSVVGIAREMFADTVCSVAEIRVRRAADTGRLRIIVPDIRPGDYAVSYSYRVDSTDSNAPLYTETYLSDADGKRFGAVSRRLERGRRERITANHTARENDRRLVLALNGYPKDMTRPSLSIDSLYVIYYMPGERAAELLRRSWYWRGGLDSLLRGSFEYHETDFVAPLADTLGSVTR